MCDVCDVSDVCDVCDVCDVSDVWYVCDVCDVNVCICVYNSTILLPKTRCSHSGPALGHK